MKKLLLRKFIASFLALQILLSPFTPVLDIMARNAAFAQEATSSASVETPTPVVTSPTVSPESTIVPTDPSVAPLVTVTGIPVISPTVSEPTPTTIQPTITPPLTSIVETNDGVKALSSKFEVSSVLKQISFVKKTKSLKKYTIPAEKPDKSEVVEKRTKAGKVFKTDIDAIAKDLNVKKADIEKQLKKSSGTDTFAAKADKKNNKKASPTPTTPPVELYQYVLFPYEVHAEVEGKLREIDSTLVIDETELFMYRNAIGAYTFRGSEYLSGGVEYTSPESKTCHYGLDSVEGVTLKDVKGVIKDNILTYPNIYNGADLVFTLSPLGVKTEVVTKSKEARKSSYTFALYNCSDSLSFDKATATAGNSSEDIAKSEPIALVEKQESKEVEVVTYEKDTSILAGVSSLVGLTADSATSSAKLDTKKTEKKSIRTLTVTIPDSLKQSSAKEVRIDPSLGTTGAMTYVAKDVTSTTLYTQSMYGVGTIAGVGEDMRSFFFFNRDTIPNGAIVDVFGGYLNVVQTQSSGDTVVGVYPVKVGGSATNGTFDVGSWLRNNTHPGTTGLTVIDQAGNTTTAPADTVGIPKNYGGEVGARRVHVPPWVISRWKYSASASSNGGWLPTEGLMLKSENGKGFRFYSVNNATQSNQPFMVAYVSTDVKNADQGRPPTIPKLMMPQAGETIKPLSGVLCDESQTPAVGHCRTPIQYPLVVDSGDPDGWGNGDILGVEFCLNRPITNDELRITNGTPTSSPTLTPTNPPAGGLPCAFVYGTSPGISYNATLTDGVTWWKSQAKDRTNKVSGYSPSFSFTVDTTPPEVPIMPISASYSTLPQLSATAGKTIDNVSLPTDIYYQMRYAKLPSANYQLQTTDYVLSPLWQRDNTLFQVGPTGADGIANTPDDIKDNETYVVQVKAKDATGNISAWSTPVTITVDSVKPVLTELIGTDRLGASKPATFDTTYSESNPEKAIFTVRRVGNTFIASPTPTVTYTPTPTPTPVTISAVFSIAANTVTTNTISVTTGDVVTVTYQSGTAVLYPPYGAHPASGMPNTTLTCTKVATAQFGSLVGRIGASGAWFPIGTTKTFTATSTGTLQLGLNECDGYYYDDSGSLSVRVQSVAGTPPQATPTPTLIPGQSQQTTLPTGSPTANTTLAVSAKQLSTQSVSVAKGDILDIRYESGTWLMWNGGAYVNATGYANVFYTTCTAKVQTAQAGAVVARIGTGPWFAVNAGTTIVAGATGILEIGPNDCPEYLYDNVGTITMRVKHWVTPAATATPSPSPTPDVNQVLKQEVSLTAESGPLSFMWDGKVDGLPPGAFAQDGTYTALVEVKDKAGNSGKTQEKTVVLDNSAAKVIFSAPYTGYWTNSDSFDVSGQAAAPHQAGLEDTDIAYCQVQSQLQSLTDTWTQFDCDTTAHIFQSNALLVEGENVVKIKTVDASGNTHTTQTTIYKDSTQPEITNYELGITNDHNVTNNKRPTITFNVTDNAGGSGIPSGVNPKGYAVSLNYTTTSGVQTKKLVENQLTLDPTLTTGLTCTSGVCSMSFIKDLNPDATYTISVTAADNAGNTVTKTQDFTLDTHTYLAIDSPVAGGLYVNSIVSLKGTIEKNAVLKVLSSKFQVLNTREFIVNEQLNGTGKDDENATDKLIAENFIVTCTRVVDNIPVCDFETKVFSSFATDGADTTNNLSITATDAATNQILVTRDYTVNPTKFDASIAPNTQYFSPNGDGVQDGVNFMVNVKGQMVNDELPNISHFTFEISHGTDVVRTISGSGMPPTQIVWDGKTDNNLFGLIAGSNVPDGTYIYKLTLTTADGITKVAIPAEGTPQTVIAKSTIQDGVVIASPTDNQITNQGVISVSGIAPASENTISELLSQSDILKGKVEVVICATLSEDNTVENCVTTDSSSTGSFSTLVVLPTSPSTTTKKVYLITAFAKDSYGNKTDISNTVHVMKDTAGAISNLSIEPNIIGATQQAAYDAFTTANSAKTVKDVRSVLVTTFVEPGTQAIEASYADYTNLTPGNTTYLGLFTSTTEDNDKYNPDNNTSNKKNLGRDTAIHLNDLTANGPTSAQGFGGQGQQLTACATATGCAWSFFVPIKPSMGGIYDIVLKAKKGDVISTATSSFRVDNTIPTAPYILQVQKWNSTTNAWEQTNEYQNKTYTNSTKLKLGGSGEPGTFVELKTLNLELGSSSIATITTTGANGQELIANSFKVPASGIFEFVWNEIQPQDNITQTYTLTPQSFELDENNNRYNNQAENTKQTTTIIYDTIKATIATASATTHSPDSRNQTSPSGGLVSMFFETTKLVTEAFITKEDGFILNLTSLDPTKFLGDLTIESIQEKFYNATLTLKDLAGNITSWNAKDWFESLMSSSAAAAQDKDFRVKIDNTKPLVARIPFTLWQEGGKVAADTALTADSVYVGTLNEGFVSRAQTINIKATAEKNSRVQFFVNGNIYGTLQNVSTTNCVIPPSNTPSSEDTEDGQTITLPTTDKTTTDGLITQYAEQCAVSAQYTFTGDGKSAGTGGEPQEANYFQIQTVDDAGNRSKLSAPVYVYHDAVKPREPNIVMLQDEVTGTGERYSDMYFEMIAPDGMVTTSKKLKANHIGVAADNEGGLTQTMHLIFKDLYGIYTIKLTSYDAAGNVSGTTSTNIEKVEPPPEPVYTVADYLEDLDAAEEYMDNSTTHTASEKQAFKQKAAAQRKQLEDMAKSEQEQYWTNCTSSPCGTMREGTDEDEYLLYVDFNTRASAAFWGSVPFVETGLDIWHALPWVEHDVFTGERLTAFDKTMSGGFALLPFAGATTVRQGVKFVKYGDIMYNTSKQVVRATELILIAKDGQRIKGFTNHGVDRVIGDMAQRAGVPPTDIIDALKNPTNNPQRYIKNGLPQVDYIGKDATVIVNPDNELIVTIWPN